MIEREWDRSFAAARNHALDAATMDWILSVNADELTRGMPVWLPELLQTCGDELDALWIQIDNRSCPDAPATAVHRELRMFQASVARWSGRVHEKLVSRDGGALRTADFPVETLQLVHHGYDDRLTALTKAMRNADLAAQQLAEDQEAAAPSSVVARSALDLGRSYVGAGRFDLAYEPLMLAQQLGDADAQHWARYFLVRCPT